MGDGGNMLTQQEAQHIVRKLGESGIPPTRGLEAYTVGMDSLLGTLTSEYLGGYLRDGGSSFKLVVGEYGSGKSHFLYRLRDIAWEQGQWAEAAEASRCSAFRISSSFALSASRRAFSAATSSVSPSFSRSSRSRPAQ